MALVTNTHNITSALALKAKAKGCRICALTYTKVGKEVGRAPNKVVVGNDRVYQQFLSGISYGAMKKRDLSRLDVLDAAAWIAENPVVGGFTVNAVDFDAAFTETRESTILSINGENSSPTDDAFVPLMVNGEVVHGGKVYKGNNPDIMQDTMYLWGLCIRSEVLVPGNPVPPHKYREAKTAIKDALRRILPSSRFVSYRLTPGQDYELNIGGVDGIVTVADDFGDDLLD